MIYEPKASMEHEKLYRHVLCDPIIFTVEKMPTEYQNTPWRMVQLIPFGERCIVVMERLSCALVERVPVGTTCLVKES